MYQLTRPWFLAWVVALAACTTGAARAILASDDRRVGTFLCLPSLALSWITLLATGLGFCGPCSEVVSGAFPDWAGVSWIRAWNWLFNAHAVGVAGALLVLCFVIVKYRNTPLLRGSLFALLAQGFCAAGVWMTIPTL